MILCQSLSVVWIVGTRIGGEDTQTLTDIIKFIRTFLHSEMVGMLKHCSDVLTPLHSCSPTSRLVKLSMPHILLDDT